MSELRRMQRALTVFLAACWIVVLGCAVIQPEAITFICLGWTSVWLAVVAFVGRWAWS